MVNWFEPAILFQTGIKALISSLFGNYADRREMEAALDMPLPGSIISNTLAEYSDLDEIWVDFISDTGDGFNSTYSVASTVAQPYLTVEDDGAAIKLPRGRILILGGDQIYPTPTGEIYDTKFRIPFESALPKIENDENNPHMYAIPGNHDWYDGLGSFMKVFCQQRRIGNWKTFQTRSYFALSLPHNFWFWATDVQLNEDIDKPQLDYFLKVAKTQMQPGDKVILCTAEPAWVYRQLYPENTSYDRLRFFIETYITDDRAGLIGKKFTLATALTGDLHHYSHYCFKDESGQSNHYIGAGGGGAFTHLTHNLPKKLTKIKEPGITLETIFPDKKDSYRLLLGNLLFPFINYYFSALLGSIYLLFYWLLQSRFVLSQDESYRMHLNEIAFNKFLSDTSNLILYTPVLGLLSALLLFGFYKFTDLKTGKTLVWIWGILHALVQVTSIFAIIWLTARLTADFGSSAIFLSSLFFAGSIIGGFLMGFYLFLSNLLWAIHIDESSSALASAHYKNFLRLHISPKGLTIYPIGIRKVTTQWKQTESEKDIVFSGRLPEYHLIEKPIHIKN